MCVYITCPFLPSHGLATSTAPYSTAVLLVSTSSLPIQQVFPTGVYSTTRIRLRKTLWNYRVTCWMPLYNPRIIFPTQWEFFEYKDCESVSCILHSP